MNYEKLYFSFINKFKGQVVDPKVYTERHHILPRYLGGSDEDDNLVKLTHRQHTFVHHLFARWTGDAEAWLAYKMMSGQDINLKVELARLGGLKNVKSGHLDRIRNLANTEVRKEKLKKLQEEMKKDGRLDYAISKAQKAWKGSKHTEDYKKSKSEKYKSRFSTDLSYRLKILNTQKIGIKIRSENSKQLSDDVIKNAKRDKTFLTKTSSRSKSVFVSPEGLIFDSPIFAAGYYGNVRPHAIENWCKRNQHGWKRIPKMCE